MNPVSPDVRYMYMGNPDRVFGKEIMIADKAEELIIKLLKLKYPNNQIDEYSIAYRGLYTPIIFGKIYAAAFIYKDQEYEVETNNKKFICKDIKIRKPYQLKILEIAKKKLGISEEEFVIDYYNERKIEEEKVYFFAIDFENKKNLLCFNETGEEREWENIVK